MNFSHLTQGQPLEISASDWNAMIDMAKTYCQNKLSTTVPVADNQRFIVEGATTAYVQNASEVYDASFGTTLCIDGLANGQEVMKEKVRPTFKGVIPSTPKETGVPFDSWKWSHGKYCVCCEPIPMGAVGRAVIAGIAVAQVYVEKEWHFRCDIDKIGNKWFLKSYAGGSSEILWKQPGTGSIRLAIIKMGCNPYTHFYGKMAGLLYESGWNEMRLYRFDQEQEEWVDSEYTETVYSPPLHSGASGSSPVPRDAWVSAYWNPFSYRLELDGRQC